MTSMQARYDELSGQLARLNGSPARAEASGPPNPGFEPGPSRVVQLAVAAGPPRPPAAGRSPATRPTPSRSTRSSRIRAAAASGWTPGSRPRRAVSDRFTPSVQSSLTVQAWLRADRPDAKVRVWIEGEAAGRPFVRRSELTAGPDWAAWPSASPTCRPGARQRPAPVRADDGRQPLDRRPGLAGETLSEPERLNAATPCWRPCTPTARSASPTSPGWPARTGPGCAGTGDGGHGREGPGRSAGMLRTGDATALPPGRRLR